METRHETRAGMSSCRHENALCLHEKRQETHAGMASWRHEPDMKLSLYYHIDLVFMSPPRRISSPSHNATRMVLRWNERTEAMAAKPKEVIDTFCTRNTLT